MAARRIAGGGAGRAPLGVPGAAPPPCARRVQCEGGGHVLCVVRAALFALRAVDRAREGPRVPRSARLGRPRLRAAVRPPGLPRRARPAGALRDRRVRRASDRDPVGVLRAADGAGDPLPGALPPLLHPAQHLPRRRDRPPAPLRHRSRERGAPRRRRGRGAHGHDARRGGRLVRHRRRRAVQRPQVHLRADGADGGLRLLQPADVAPARAPLRVFGAAGDPRQRDAHPHHLPRRQLRVARLRDRLLPRLFRLRRLHRGHRADGRGRRGADADLRKTGRAT